MVAMPSVVYACVCVTHSVCVLFAHVLRINVGASDCYVSREYGMREKFEL